ncbi:hypothetical protein ACF0AV_15365 [Acinetobacter baumannii]|uniref:hypothetical protein n=2 Tax=Acinetobacter baumannii TaxID=470 RepID=UPI0026DF77C1|nr:hypothetical protein [Acinetobacter baumannii]MDO5925257.1 hypothetical protein [Acinetobacter baumannii]MDP4328201.1 hypothetical protein [Acinetobacter baumannii]HCR9932990.1 hypothetical protein [Acinetobacter baumannii]
MSNRVSTPFPIYNDTDGTPLDAGFIFIGQKGKNPIASPIAIFYDAALTMPAENPLRTRNGYVVKNGAPREVFTADPIVSILVQNKQKIDIWNAAFINLNPGITPDAVVDLVTGDSQADINATILKKGENLDDLPNKDEARTNLEVYSKDEVDEKFTNKVKDASETEKGIIRVATSAEAKAGELDNVAITPKKMPEAVAKALGATGDAPVFGARAFGVFGGDGTRIGGGNFESVTRVSVGLYEVTLTKALPDNKYGVVANCAISGRGDARSANEDADFADKSTTKFRIVCHFGGDNTQGRFDPVRVNFHIF